MTHIQTRLFSRGFTLLEVLIAIVVLSIGLLGVATLQMVSLKNNQSTLFQSQASALAFEMIDRMRVNRRAVASYDTGTAYWNYGSDCATAKFSGATNLYQKDFNDWLLTLCKRLPSGEGKITIDSSKSLIEVSIRWNDSRSTGKTSADPYGEVNVKSQYQICPALPDSCNNF
jgi:type IV pilus assembly protein PilV